MPNVLLREPDVAREFSVGTIDKVIRLRAEFVRRGLEHVDIEVDDGVDPDNI